MSATRPPGFTLWFTGLSGAGKSTLATHVSAALAERGLLVEQLDGDIVRTHLSKGLGFSKEDRDTNIERIGWVAARLARAGVAVVVSAISPFAEARGKARGLVEEHGTFVEIYVATSLETCAARDVKGLYRRAFAGEIADFTGVSSPYEPPLEPEIEIDTAGASPEESAAAVVARLEQLGVLPP